jgi:hypothetical protein
MMCFLLFSCGSKFEKLEAYYYTEDYLEAATLSVTYYSDKKVKPKIDSFIEAFGSRLVRKSMEDADSFSLNVESMAGLIYIENLIATFENMEALKFKIKELPLAIEQLNNLFDERRKYYISVHYSKGINAYEDELFQKSLTHFNNVSFYQPTYRELIEYKKRATVHAQRRIVIDPFYQEHISLKDYVAKVFKKPVQGEIQKYEVVIQGLNVSNYLPHRLQEDSEKLSSDYMSYFVQDGDVSTSTSHYQVIGKLDISENDFTVTNITEIKSEMVNVLIAYDDIEVWEKAMFQYEVLKSGYELTVDLKVSVIDIKTQDVVKQFFIKKTDGEEVLYRGHIIQEPENTVEIIYPEAYMKVMETPLFINKRRVVENVLDRVSQEVAQKVNKLVDKDFDPVSFNK